MTKQDPIFQLRTLLQDQENQNPWTKVCSIVEEIDDNDVLEKSILFLQEHLHEMDTISRSFVIYDDLDTVQKPKYWPLVEYIEIGADKIDAAYHRLFEWGKESHAKHISFQECDVIEDIRFLKSFRKLEKVDFTYCGQVHCYEQLKDIRSLKALALIIDELEEVQFLEHLPQLRELTVQSERMEDYSPLLYCQSLESLSLLHTNDLGEKLDDSIWERLTKFSVYAEQGATSLPYLTKLKKVVELEIAGEIPLKNLDCIAHLNDLEKLKIYGDYENHLENVASLRHFTKMKELFISGAEFIDEIDAIGSLTLLKKLTLIEARSWEDFSFLLELSEMEELSITYCDRLANLSFLSAMPKLSTLDLKGCSQLRSIEGLHHCQHLESLNLSYCHYISSLAPLLKLPELRELTSRESSFPDITPHEDELLTKKDVAKVKKSIIDYYRPFEAIPVTFSKFIQAITLEPSDESWQELWKTFEGFHPETEELSPEEKALLIERLEVFVMNNLRYWPTHIRSADIGVSKVKEEPFLLRFVQSVVIHENFDPKEETETFSWLQRENIKSLRLCYVHEFTNLSSFPIMPNITVLDIDECAFLESLEGIESFPDLRWLDIKQCDSLKDYSQIAQCSKLSRLSFVWCGDLDNLDFAKGLEHLDELYFFMCFGLKDLSGIKDLTSLQYLQFNYAGSTPNWMDVVPEKSDMEEEEVAEYQTRLQDFYRSQE